MAACSRSPESRPASPATAARTGDVTLPDREGAVSAEPRARRCRPRAHPVDAHRDAAFGQRHRRGRRSSGRCVRGDLRDDARGVALAFAGTVEGRRVTLDRLQARAGAGEISGSGSIALDGARAFAVTARATRFDPSRLVARCRRRCSTARSTRAGHARARVGRDGRARARAGQPFRGRARERHGARARDAHDGEGRRTSTRASRPRPSSWAVRSARRPTRLRTRSTHRASPS